MIVRGEHNLRQGRLERVASRHDHDPPSGVDTTERATRRRSSPKALLVAADVGALILAINVATTIRLIIGSGFDADALRTAIALGVGSLPLWLLAFVHNRLYSTRFITRGLDEFRRIVHAVTAGTIGVAMSAFALKIDLSRSWLVYLGLSTLVMVSIERAAARKVFDHLRSHGSLLRRVVIVGRNAEGLAIQQMLANDSALGYEVVGFVDDEMGGRAVGLGADAPVLGSLDQTMDVIDRIGASGAVIAASAMDLATSNRLIRELTDAGVHVELSSTLRDIASDRLTVRPLGRFPVVYIEPVARHGWRPVAKRTFDIVVAGVTFLLALPVLAAAAVVIKLDSRGPVLFRQTRVGQHGLPFEVLKLRTMVVDAEERLAGLLSSNESEGPLFKMRDDPRVTRVGRFLRKASIDELPQLWNVLRNEMSLVGPRPALPREIEDWGTELHQRLRVKPGITGMWQVHGRGVASFELYERLDLYYVDNWSLVNDVVIVAQTIPSVLARRGAH